MHRFHPTAPLNHELKPQKRPEARVEFGRNQANFRAMQYSFIQELGEYEMMPFTSLTTAYLLLHKYYKNRPITNK